MKEHRDARKENGKVKMKVKRRRMKRYQWESNYMARKKGEDDTG